MARIDCVPFAGDLKKGVEHLGACELFSEFSTEARRRVLDCSKTGVLQPGQLLFEEGQPCEALYVLLEGSVKVNKVNVGGKEQVLRQLKPGQIFGAPPLFSPKGVYPATAVALETSTVLCVPKLGLIKLLKEKPELMLKALGQVSQYLLGMVRLAESMSLDTVPRRVAAYLLKVAKEQGGPKPGQVILLGGNQTQLAAELGTVREVLGRSLHAFRKQGLLQVKGRQVTLLDPQGLEEAPAS